MKQNESASEPLKIYQKAYLLHHRDNRAEEACVIYEKLIREFPESDVSAYASIQLQKIHAKDYVNGAGRNRNLTVLVLCVLNILLTLGLASVILIQQNAVSKLRFRSNALFQITAKMHAGKLDDAIDMLKIVKLSAPDDITPFVLSSEIYRKNHDYLNARKELETFRRLNPGNPLIDIELASINEEEDMYIGRTMKKESEKKTELPEEVIREQDLQEKKRIEDKNKRTPGIVPSKKKTQLLIPEDSLSFF